MNENFMQFQLSGICAGFPGPEYPEGSYHYAENLVTGHSLTENMYPQKKRFIASNVFL